MQKIKIREEDFCCMCDRHLFSGDKAYYGEDGYIYCPDCREEDKEREDEEPGDNYKVSWNNE